MANEAKSSERVSGRKPDSETFDADLEWLLIAGAAAMGERGTLAGTIAQLQLGGPVGGVPETDLYNDAQIGWGRTVVGSVERHRSLMAAWNTLDATTRQHLVLCYTAPPAAFRSDQGFGARDTCPPVEDLIKKNGEPGEVVEPQRGSHASTRTGTDARLGRLAALALRVVEHPAKLLVACYDPQKGGNGKVITRALKLAQEAATKAHAAWYAAKGGARPPRKTSERRKVLPAVVGGDE